MLLKCRNNLSHVACQEDWSNSRGLQTTCLHQHTDKQVEIMAKLLVLFSAATVDSSCADAYSAPKLDSKLAELDDITQAAKGKCEIHGRG